MYPLSLCPCLGFLRECGCRLHMPTEKGACLGFLRECGCRLHMPTERGASTDRTKQAEETQRATSNTTAAGQEPGTATGRWLGVHAISLGCTNRKGRTAQHSSGRAPAQDSRSRAASHVSGSERREVSTHSVIRDSRHGHVSLSTVALPALNAPPVLLSSAARCGVPSSAQSQPPHRALRSLVLHPCLADASVETGVSRHHAAAGSRAALRHANKHRACTPGHADRLHRRTLGPAALVSGLRVAAPALRVSFFPAAASPDTLQSARFSARSSPHGGAVAVARWHGAGARRAAARCARVQLGSNLAQTYLLFSTDGQTEERRKLQSSLCIEG